MSSPGCIGSDPNYKDRILPILAASDIPTQWRDSPIEEFIKLKNFRETIPESDSPRLLIAACIEFRYALEVPPAL